MNIINNVNFKKSEINFNHQSKKKLYLLSPSKAMSRMIKELPENLMEKIEMKENGNQKEIPFSSLHVEYHQILQKSVSSNDFSLAKAALNSIERLNNIEEGLSVEWGDNEWEMDLKKKLTNTQQPETKLDSFRLLSIG